MSAVFAWIDAQPGWTFALLFGFVLFVALIVERRRK